MSVLVHILKTDNCKSKIIIDTLFRLHNLSSAGIGAEIINDNRFWNLKVTTCTWYFYTAKIGSWKSTHMQCMIAVLIFYIILNDITTIVCQEKQ